MRRITRNIVIGGLGLIALSLISGSIVQVFATRADIDRLSAGAQFYDVNGKSLYLNCVGSMGPIVVFEPGAGSWSAQWTHVQEPLAQMVRVCTYDRAGIGLSEAAPQQMSGEDYVRDLHDLLRIAGEEPPYILVGHSLGGYLARLFHTIYRIDVAGIVLADSAHEDQWTRLPSEIDEMMTDALGQMRVAGWMARFGLMRMIGIPDQGLPREGQEYSTKAVMMTTRYWKALLLEFEIGMRALPDAVRATPDLADLPLLVITAAKSADIYCATDGSNGISCDEAQSAWDQMQIELAELSSNSRQVVLPDATHAVYIDDPDGLVKYIREFTQSVRANRLTAQK